MAKAKASEFVGYIRSKVGSAYLWGGQGETLFGMARKLAGQTGQSAENTEKMVAYMRQQGVKDMGFFDCSGLGVSYLLPAGAISYDMTADGFYRKCAKVDKKGVRPGDMAFLLNVSKKATHIGYVTDTGTVVHALNQTRGVIEEPLDRRSWVFGRPEFCMEYDLGTGQDVDVGSLKAGDRLTLKQAAKGYNTAADALAATRPAVTYPAGEYYVYKVYGGAVNITRSKGKAGAWVVI